MNKKAKMPIVVGLVILTMALLFYQGFRASGSVGVYLTIEEALANFQADQNKFIQMEGTVDPKSVKYDPSKPMLAFDIKDDKSNLIKVEFSDIKPDNFDSGYPIIVEGKFTRPGEFKADKLKIKCPSKYEEEPQAK